MSTISQEPITLLGENVNGTGSGGSSGPGQGQGQGSNSSIIGSRNSAFQPYKVSRLFKL